MIFRKYSIITLSLLFSVVAFGQIKKGTTGKYSYEYVEDDPLKTRIYTLENGLKVYMSVNKLEPRIQTFIPVRTGSKNDPSDVTGLAHYLEHMIFKGSSKMGTIDWEKESKVLKQISDAYEEHKAESNPEKKKMIYKKIDSLSTVAAQYTVPNEYDKLIKSVGAKGTNAYTSLDETVYVNDIPSNELEKWLKLESERFSELVLRIFHTELETVYEEFNMRSQDADGFKVFMAALEELFKKHTYGLQTTIGKSEHLKNPSMVKIHEYFDTYYVPNNMAICLSGDIDPDKTIAMVDKYFGKFKSKDVPVYKFEEEDPIAKPITREVFGPEAESVWVVWRTKGTVSEDEPYLDLVSMILSNGQAGLIDLNVNKEQKLLGGSAFSQQFDDYGFFGLSGNPKEGQSLEEVKSILMAELEKLKKGEFDDWLLPAIIKDLKYSEIKRSESNRGRARAFVNAFINEYQWDKYVSYLDDLSKISKEQIVKWANTKLKDNNYVVVYKRKGEDPNAVTIEKPQITALNLEKNRAYQSEFAKEFLAMASNRIKPEFVDYKTRIKSGKLTNGLEISYIKNELNETFDLNYILDMGSNHNKKLGIALAYLPYLGTNKYSAADLQREFFKLGLVFDVDYSDDRVYVSLSGLEESLEEGVKLFEHILAEVKVDNDAYNNLVARILKGRQNRKTDKGTIMYGGMFSYAKFGPKSAYTNIISEEELLNTNPQEYVDLIKSLTSYKHRIFYYGQKEMSEVINVLDGLHEVPAKLKGYPEEIDYAELDINKNEVLLVDFDMAQAQILMVTKDTKFDKTLAPEARLFNEYFGRGLSSIVFQEIREARALAYSAFANFSTPSYADKSHYVYAFVGTQVDKTKNAVDAISELMNDMPEALEQFNGAKEAIMKKIETERITKSSVFWNYEAAKRKGLDYDIRKDVYEGIQDMSIADLKKFFETHIKGKKYTYLVLADKEKIDMEALKALGEVRELTLEEIFNY